MNIILALPKQSTHNPLLIDMKKDIHPAYYKEAKVACACGNKFTVGSTMQEIRTEICSNCHPFYTGKQNLIDTAGRVDRFKAMVKKTAAARANKGKKKAKPGIIESAPLDNKAKLARIKKGLDNK